MPRSNFTDGQAETEAVSERVVTAVAEARDVDPLDLPPLYDVVDPDALNALFATTGTTERTVPGRIMFGMAGCEVTVYSDGGVDVDNQPEPSPGSSFADRTSADSAETQVGE